jgi:NADPH:quinone reductase-like Zn-dependent oxidoreductase
MKAAVCRTYGPPDVVRVEDVPTPQPKDNEVLVRISASTVSSADWRVRSLQLPRGFGLFARPAFGLFGPRKPILGTELSGTIEAVGRAVTRFRVGEAVFAFPGSELGCHAEYRTMPEDGRIARTPPGLAFEEATALSFGGTTALYYLRDLAKVRAGDEVLIVGASGTVGSAAVQLARHFGARVTGVTSTVNLERVQALGADRVLDYTKEDFSRGKSAYDIIVDTVGVTDFAACAPVLKDGGRLALVAATLTQMLGSLRGRPDGKRILTGSAKERVEDLLDLQALAAQGHFRPLIDRRYPLDQIAAAHAYVDTGRKRGSVVVTIGPAAEDGEPAA